MEGRRQEKNNVEGAPNPNLTLTVVLLAHYDINNQEIENDEELKIKVKLYNDQEIENDVELIKVKLFKDVLLKLRRNTLTDNQERMLELRNEQKKPFLSAISLIQIFRCAGPIFECLLR